jgi:hypothetical protein
MNIQHHRRSHVNSFPRNVKMLVVDRRIDQDVLVLEGIDYFSTVGRKLRSALQIDTTEEDKLSESIEAILARILIDEQSRLTNSA